MNNTWQAYSYEMRLYPITRDTWSAVCALLGIYYGILSVRIFYQENAELVFSYTICCQMTYNIE